MGSLKRFINFGEGKISSFLDEVVGDVTGWRGASCWRAFAGTSFGFRGLHGSDASSPGLFPAYGDTGGTQMRLCFFGP
jgi:hypothetical protein